MVLGEVPQQFSVYEGGSGWCTSSFALGNDYLLFLKYQPVQEWVGKENPAKYRLSKDSKILVPATNVWDLSTAENQHNAEEFFKIVSKD